MTHQHCIRGHVGQRYYDDVRSCFTCIECGSADVEPCIPCVECRAALQTIEEQCTACAIAFYTAFPLEFNERETAPGGRLFWHMTPEHIEAANQIRNAIQRHNGVKAA